MTRAKNPPKGKAAKADSDQTKDRPSLDILTKQALELWGTNSVIMGNDDFEQKSYTTFLPTGIFMLDLALMGGIPESAMTLVVGEPSAGKSLLSYRTIAAAQSKYPDRKVVCIDFEGSYKKDWGIVNGVDHDRLIVLYPHNGEQAADFVAQALRAPDCSLVVLDSIAFMPMKAELDKSHEDKTMAEKARMLSRLFSISQAAMNEARGAGHPSTFLCINQLRDSLSMYGSPVALPGGKAQNYMAAVKIKLRSKVHYARNSAGLEVPDHNEHTFTIEKSKTGSNTHDGAFYLVRNPEHPRGVGFIDDGETVLTYAKVYGLFTGGGAHQKLDGISRKFSTRAEAVEYLYDHPEHMARLKQLIIGMHRFKNKMVSLPPDKYVYGWLDEGAEESPGLTEEDVA